MSGNTLKISEKLKTLNLELEEIELTIEELKELNNESTNPVGEFIELSASLAVLNAGAYAMKSLLKKEIVIIQEKLKNEISKNEENKGQVNA